MEQEISLDEFKFHFKNDCIKIYLYNYFTTSMPIEDLNSILKKFNGILKNISNGNLIIEAKEIIDPNQFAEFLKFRLNHYFPLKNEINGRDAYYVTEPVPLFGILGFGIVDRGTNVVELRPINGCVFDCLHCSVNEEKSNKRKRDFVVDYNYFIRYVEEFIREKVNDVFIFINPQGETLLYSKLTDFIKGLKRIKKVKKIAITTRLPFWNYRLMDELLLAGLDQINLSLDTLDDAKYKQLAGSNFNVNRVVKFIEEYHKKMNIILTPVWLPGINDLDLVEVLELCKKYNLGFGLQNYVRHKFGRKLKEKTWEEFQNFYNWLIEKVSYKGDHMFENIIKDYKPRNIFNIGDEIEVKIIFPGRMMNEFIAQYKDRIITVVNDSFKNVKLGSSQKVKIVRLNDNIALGKL
ncbi:MAG: radical SAM protein [Candidatus Woesearchaeota archaeon]